MSTPRSMLNGANEREGERSQIEIRALLVAPVLLLTLFFVSCGGTETPTLAPTIQPQTDVDLSTGGSLTIYSAREQTLVGPIIQQFEDATGIEVGVKYGSNSGLAATIQEEGSKQSRRRLLCHGPGFAGEHVRSVHRIAEGNIGPGGL